MADGGAEAASAADGKILAKDLNLGDIVWVRFPEAHHVGAELYADTPRPYVVVSPRPRIQGIELGIVLAVPFTMGGEAHRFATFRSEITPDEITREDERLRDVIQLAVVEQLRAISEGRIVGRAGKLSQYGINQIKASLIYVLGLDEHKPAAKKA